MFKKTNDISTKYNSMYTKMIVFYVYFITIFYSLHTESTIQYIS